MADYDIFREQMGITFPKYGHALWDPSPPKPDRPVQVGDVGFIRMGKFHCLFNVLRPKGEQVNVPEGYEPLVPKSSPHITQRSLNSGHYCSVGVSVDVEQDMHLASPNHPREVSTKCSGRRGGALLSLPVNARREDTLAQKAFGEWMVKHIGHWFAFAQGLQLGVECMEEIILVTGCDRTRSWTNIAFLEGQVDAKGTDREVVERADGSIEVQFSSGHVAGVLSHGPQGKNLPEDQCVFIRGFRVARTSNIFPKRLGAAAYPSPEPERYDHEPVAEPLSIPATTRYRDPLHVLLDYIAERAYGCDMVLVHDNDLGRIDGIGEGSSLGSLEPEVMKDLLRSSDLEIQKDCCDLSSASGSPNSDVGVVWVAMLATSSKTRNSVLPSQALSPAAHLRNPALTPRLANDSPVSSRSAASSSSLPPIPGDADSHKEFATQIRADDPHFVLRDLCESASLINSSALDKIGDLPSLAEMWSSISILAHGEHHKLVAVVAVAFFAGALFGWMLSSYWLDISKYWFSILLASFTLYSWLERKHTHRMLGEIHEWMGVLQHYIMSSQSSATVNAVAADARNDRPIMIKITTANREMTAQRTPLLAIATPSGHNEPRVEISHAHEFMAATPQETVESESSIVDLGAAAPEQYIEHPGSNTVSGPTPVAEPSLPDGCPDADPSTPSATGDLSQVGKIKGTPISPTLEPHIPAELPIKLSEYPGKQCGPQNLPTTTNTDVAPPVPSAFATARHIEDITRITYPQDINRPELKLNVNAQKGKFRYDREFLLQFMHICKEKPDNIFPLDVIGLKSSNMSHTISRGGSGRRNSLSMPSPSIRLRSIPDSMGETASSGVQLDQYSTSASKISGDERFLAASTRRSMSVVGGPLGSRPLAMVRTISQSGTGRNRTRSKRGANDSSRTNVAGNAGPTPHISAMGPPMEHVAPLEMSANRWVAISSRRNGPDVDSDFPELVERKVKGLLNKLSMGRFESISDQIIAWANKSESEKDGRPLIQVIKLIFKSVADEKTISAVYARLCRKMMDKISPKVQDDGIKNAEGKPFAGGQLFRKYLLNCCQEDFERRWVAEETTAAAASSKTTEDWVVEESNEKTKGEESQLYSDEYYVAAKANRRGLGLIRLIGELFKRQMLTERIIHECIKKFLSNVENPKEEAIESLCRLLATVGSLLDTRKARAHLDVYFSRMRELTKNKNVNARMMFMLQDVIELRERRWAPRRARARPGPMTIAQILAAATKESEVAQNVDSCMPQNASMSRGGSRGDGNCDAAEPSHPDGSSVAGPSAPTRPPSKAGYLSQFGKISNATPIFFGPGNTSTGKKAADPKNCGPPMSSVPQRPKLQPLRRSRHVGEESKASTPVVSNSGSEDEAAGQTGSLASPAMSEAESKAKIQEDTKEFFSLRMLEEAESYFSSLPPEHRHWLVDSLVTKSIEMKEPDVNLVSELFVRVREKELCSLAVFEEGFTGLAEALDDLSVDVPKAWPYFAILLRASGLNQDEERRGRIAEKTMDSDKLNRLL